MFQSGTTSVREDSMDVVRTATWNTDPASDVNNVNSYPNSFGAPQVQWGHADSNDFFPLLSTDGVRRDLKAHFTSEDHVAHLGGNGHNFYPCVEPSLETILDNEEIKRNLEMRFRCSGFLQSVIEYVDTRQKDIQSQLDRQINQLRVENTRLRQRVHDPDAESPLNVPRDVQPPPPGSPSYALETTPDQKAHTPDLSTRCSVDHESHTKMHDAIIRARGSAIDRGKSTATLASVSSVPATEIVSRSHAESEENYDSVSPLNRCSRKRQHGGVNLGVRMSHIINRMSKSVSSIQQSVHRDGVFADIETMKAEIRQAIFRKPYNVAQYYHDTGYCQMIARSALFEYVTLFVIFSNSIWIAIDVDLNHSSSINEADFIFQFVEYFFFGYFFIEWVIRFSAFRTKRDTVNDWWFLFDSGLVLMMIVDIASVQLAEALSSDEHVPNEGKGDTTNASILRLLRLTKLTRMARMARLLRAMPELTILVKGIWVATRSVFFTLCLLAILIYVFSVAFRQLTDNTPVGDKYFASVPKGMKSLLLYGTLPDFYPMVEDCGAEHILLGIMLLFFILLGSLTVMNMLVGVLVEVVSVVSAVEKEELKVNFVKSQLLGILKRNGMDAHEEMILSREEFEFLFLKQGAAKVFNDIGVDPVGFVDTSAYIFKEAGSRGVTFRQFIELVLSMRGTNTATVKDMVDLRRVLLEKMEILEMYIKDSKLNTNMRRMHQSRLSPPQQIRASEIAGGSSFHTARSMKSITASQHDEVDSTSTLGGPVPNLATQSVS